MSSIAVEVDDREPRSSLPSASEMNTPSPSSSVMSILFPIMGVVVFVGFVVIGVALPVLPLHVSHDLGLSAFVVGLVTGSQFGASLFSRIWAGHYADSCLSSHFCSA